MSKLKLMQASIQSSSVIMIKVINLTSLQKMNLNSFSPKSLSTFECSNSLFGMDLKEFYTLTLDLI